MTAPKLQVNTSDRTVKNLRVIGKGEKIAPRARLTDPKQLLATINGSKFKPRLVMDSIWHRDLDKVVGGAINFRLVGDVVYCDGWLIDSPNADIVLAQLAAVPHLLIASPGVILDSAGKISAVVSVDIADGAGSTIPPLADKPPSPAGRGRRLSAAATERQFLEHCRARFRRPGVRRAYGGDFSRYVESERVYRRLLGTK